MNNYLISQTLKKSFLDWEQYTIELNRDKGRIYPIMKSSMVWCLIYIIKNLVEHLIHKDAGSQNAHKEPSNAFLGYCFQNDGWAKPGSQTFRVSGLITHTLRVVTRYVGGGEVTVRLDCKDLLCPRYAGCIILFDV